MADGFYNADSQQRSVDGMKPWQLLRARFSETLIASHPTSPHCVRVIESKALRAFIITTICLPLPNSFAVVFLLEK
jgi:hypothetical protein